MFDSLSFPLLSFLVLLFFKSVRGFRFTATLSREREREREREDGSSVREFVFCVCFFCVVLRWVVVKECLKSFPSRSCFSISVLSRVLVQDSLTLVVIVFLVLKVSRELSVFFVLMKKKCFDSTLESTLQLSLPTQTLPTLSQYFYKLLSQRNDTRRLRSLLFFVFVF